MMLEVKQSEFDRCVSFHGHICPGLAIGFVAATEAMKRLKESRSEDEEIVAIVETNSCAVDAIQVITGCTFGKGNLLHRDHGKTVFTFLVRDTGRGLRFSVRPFAQSMDESHWALFQKVIQAKATQEEKSSFGEAHSRRALEVLQQPAEKLFLIEEVAVPLPEKARIEPSEPCDRCGEPTMRTKLIPQGELKLCRDCLER